MKKTIAISSGPNITGSASKHRYLVDRSKIRLRYSAVPYYKLPRDENGRAIFKDLT